SMRQCAGSDTVVAGASGELGGVNGPAATRLADLIVTVGMVSAARLVHGVPAEGGPIWATTGIVATTRAIKVPRIMEALRGDRLYEHHLAHDAALRHVVERFGRPIERVGRRYVRA